MSLSPVHLGPEHRLPVVHVEQGDVDGGRGVLAAPGQPGHHGQGELLHLLVVEGGRQDQVPRAGHLELALALALQAVGEGQVWPGRGQGQQPAAWGEGGGDERVARMEVATWNTLTSL